MKFVSTLLDLALKQPAQGDDIGNKQVFVTNIILGSLCLLSMGLVVWLYYKTKSNKNLLEVMKDGHDLVRRQIVKIKQRISEP